MSFPISSGIFCICPSRIPEAEDPNLPVPAVRRTAIPDRPAAYSHKRGFCCGLLFSRLHLLQLMSLILLIISRIQGVPYLFHQMIIKIQIVQHAKTHSQHFLCL